jgi:hypothetical protein
MARENEFSFQSATVNPKKSMKAGFDLQSAEWEVKQDVQQYKDQVKLERDKEQYFGKTNQGYRKMATIPDIVALEILQNHKINLHDPLFMNDKNNMKKLKTILIMEYPDLLINT